MNQENPFRVDLTGAEVAWTANPDNTEEYKMQMNGGNSSKPSSGAPTPKGTMCVIPRKSMPIKLPQYCWDGRSSRAGHGGSHEQEVCTARGD